MPPVNVFVTGASSGIGLATARAFYPLGGHVALCSRRLDMLKKHAATLGDRAFALRADVREMRSMQIAADHVKKKWGSGPDVVVVNAGTVATGEISTMDPERWKDVMDTNLNGAFHTARAFLPDMIGRPTDLVFIASTAAYQVWPTWGAYCASKWGVLALAKSVSEEVRKKGVRVTVISPGAVDTEIWAGAGSKPDPAKMLKPSEVADAIVHAVTAPRGASYDEIRIMPADGLL